MAKQLTNDEQARVDAYWATQQIAEANRMFEYDKPLTAEKIAAIHTAYGYAARHCMNAQLSLDKLSKEMSNVGK